MDRIDQKILLELQADARLSIVELSRRVGLTKTPCAERVRRLEKTGVIRGYHAALDPDAVGAGHIVVVQVLLTTAPPSTTCAASTRPCAASPRSSPAT